MHQSTGVSVAKGVLNMRSRHMGLVCVFATILTGVLGCTQEEIDTHADEQAIRKAEMNAVRAWNEGDIDGYMTAYPEDSEWLPPNSPRVKGAEGIRVLASQLAANPGFAFDGQVATVEVSSDGNLAYLIGTYQLTLSDQEGNLGTDHGKFVEVWKKHPDSTWNHVLAIWNSDNPCP